MGTQTATIRQYQKDGINGILSILQARKAAYLADEMGLGKTLQALQILGALKDERPALVVCPASLRLNWEREILLWSEKTPIVIPGAKDLKIFCAPHKLYNCIIIVSYELAKKTFEALTKSALNADPPFFSLLILDEAHYCKSFKAIRTTACLKDLWCCAENRLCMSGTPLPNGVIDGFTIFNKLAPETFQDYYKFGHRYTNAEKNWYTGYWEFKGGRNLKELKEKLRSVMVRRRKEQVLTELPSKVFSYPPIVIESPEKYRLTPEQLEAFKEGEAASLSVACATARRGLGLLKIAPAKEYILDILPAHNRLVVFAYHRGVLEGLQEALLGHVKTALIYGDTTQRERDSIIQDFQSNAAPPMILLAQIQAAGIGINLTAADTCIFAELDWVPANMAQAVDRLHRIGQKSSVAIHVLKARDSMDDQILGTLMKKVIAINEVLK